MARACEICECSIAIIDIFVQATSRAGMYLIENFVIHGLVGAVALPLTILNVSGLIDSCWAVVSPPVMQNWVEISAAVFLSLCVTPPNASI